MKKLDAAMDRVDHYIERHVAPAGRFIQKYFIVFSVTLLTLFLTIFVFRIFRSRTEVLGTVIVDDLAHIERVLNQLDKDCNILSIRTERAVLDFFTVERFAGSTVGCLNLAHPKKWKGPYMKQNPSVQGKLYEVVGTKEGYFVIPGYGVKLPNGLVMGKDVAIRYDTPLAAMLKPGGMLSYEGKPLGIQLKFKIGDWDTGKVSEETIDRINATLKEFNEALPFAQHQVPAPVGVVGGAEGPNSMAKA